jgi:hypothetical protein
MIVFWLTYLDCNHRSLGLLDSLPQREKPMAFPKSKKPGRKRCRKCQMGMLAVAGYGLDPGHKT